MKTLPFVRFPVYSACISEEYFMGHNDAIFLVSLVKLYLLIASVEVQREEGFWVYQWLNTRFRACKIVPDSDSLCDEATIVDT